MLGILIAIAISWLLLYLIEKKNILALGHLLIAKRLKQFSIVFLITKVLCVLFQYLESYLKLSTWILNKNLTNEIALKSFWWDLKSLLA
jgi:hypothetical protein